MKKIIFSASVIILFACASQAQTQSIVSAGGGIAKATNGIVLEWTLGEPVIGFATTANRLYTAGFHQPYITVKDILPETKIAAAAIQVYPNPVNSRLIVQLPPTQSEQIKLVLSDLTGHTLIEKQMSGKSAIAELSMEALTGGVYQLRVMKMDGSIINVFKVVKL